MKLENLIQELEYELYDAGGRPVSKDSEKGRRLLQQEVLDITNDSRHAGRGILFFAICGAKSDGHSYIPQVAAAGTTAILTEHDIDPIGAEGGVSADELVLIRVKSTRHGMALVSAAFYGHPARELKMIGITGTKGKTTTTYLVRSILEKAGMDVGLIGTIESTWHEVHRPANNTTPESLALQKRCAKWQMTAWRWW